VRFAAAWLDLREPHDHAARDPALLAAAARHLAAEPGALALDLGCGTGATFRAVAPLAPGSRWRLLDRDATLLRLAAARCGPAVETLHGDFGNLDALPLHGVRLVTASAVLDLVSHTWVEGLAARLAAARVGVYAALSYDGRMRWTPALPGDAAVREAFNRHQRGDKGLGPALGPAAAGTLAWALARRGFRVRTAPSPWRLGPEAALGRDLVAGVAAAALEAGLTGAAGWGQARRAASGACTVGHCDLLALPASSAQSKTTSEARP
jgi:hypothetical protein